MGKKGFQENKLRIRIEGYLKDNGLSPERFVGKEWDLILCANLSAENLLSPSVRLELEVKKCLKNIMSSPYTET